MKNEIKKIGNSKELKQTITNYNILKQSFGKSKSQWCEANMALNGLTPLRNIRHLLARIERAYQACKESEYKLKKLSIRKEIKERGKEKEKDKLKKKIIEIEIDEINHKIDTGLYYFRGAVKKIQHNYHCINQIMKSNNHTSFDEIDFEKEEEEYHIKTAMNQSVRVVRMTGKIDQGNQEYLEQCGINPGVAQRAIEGFLFVEGERLRKECYDSTTDSLYEFLEKCYQDFKGLSKKRLKKLGVERGFMEDVMYKVTTKDKRTLLSSPLEGED